MKRISIFAPLLIFAVVAFRADSQDARPTYPPTLGGGAACGSCIEPADLSWKAVVTSPEEPGDPLHIYGTIFQQDGKPARELSSSFTTGYYKEKDDASHPRLKGWVKMGPDGRYEFRTIKPAPYPHRTTPAHLHAHLYGLEYSERSVDDYWFEGNPFITSKELAHWRKEGEEPAIVRLKRDVEGVWQGVRDITIKPARK